MAAKYILGVDIGTGSVKAVAVNPAGKAIGSAQKHYPLLQPKPGYAEQEIETIWQSFTACIREATAKFGQPEAISLSCAMHSLILVDAAGKALTNIINWADTRSAEIAERLRASPEGETLYKETGTPVYAMSPLSKIIWFRQNQPELFNQTAKFISIKEVFWFRLFRQFQVDFSIASATGLFDILQFRWNEKALKLAGIDASKLSEAVNTTYFRQDANAEISKILGIKEATYWIIGANDGCLANLGSGANAVGTAALTIGTSGAVRVASSAPLYNFKAMTFNYILDEKTYICGGAINNGGLILNWLLANFRSVKTVSPKNYQQLFNLVNEVPAGSKGLIFLPYLTGERTPLWNGDSCGVYFGIKTEHTQAHFLKAALEGVCYAIQNVQDALKQSAGKIDEIKVSGGFTASPVWLQLMADVTGRELTVVQAEDASAVGAAYLAMQTGLFPGFKSDKIAVKNSIEPNPQNHFIYKRYYPLFTKLYADLKESMQLLNHLNEADS